MQSLISPAIGRITSPYGPRPRPLPGASKNHKGVDIAGGSLTVSSPASGTVTISAYSAARGHYVKIDHGQGVETLHQHLKSRAVVKGQAVQAAQTIGVMGRSGLATGVHLHTEVLVNGANVDPAEFYFTHGVPLGSAVVGVLRGDPPAPAPVTKGAASVLAKGSKGERVCKLQSGLRTIFPAYKNRSKIKRGVLLKVDEDFGPWTEEWVKLFQTATGLEPDGKVGPKTTAELAKYGITL